MGNGNFLGQVAAHYFGQRPLKDFVFIFPNRRPIAFFRKNLAELHAESGNGAPLLLPEMLTINDFFAKVTGKRASDYISLTVALHDCYCKVSGTAKTLDEFVCWGNAILGDFDEVDKYLCDARRLFSNISDLKGIQDDLSWTDPSQKKAIEKLASHFSGNIAGGVRKNFLSVWKDLLPLYNLYRETLTERGMAYEGMIYRELAESMEDESASAILERKFNKGCKYVFVGLNALNECERVVLSKMEKASIAEFCWDYCSGMMTEKGNDASFFLKDFTLRYPNSITVEADGRPEVSVIGVPSAAGQAELLGQILLNLKREDERRGIRSDWMDFAIVLPDESMLGYVLNNIPDEVDKVNVTMGYPLVSSEFFALIKAVAATLLNKTEKDGKVLYYHRYVYELFSESLLKNVFGKEDERTVSEIRRSAKPYIPSVDFDGSDILSVIFAPCGNIGEHLLKVIDAILDRIPEGEPLQKECAGMCRRCIARLADMNLDIQPRTFIRLFFQIASGISVPFEGEPLGGLQIMGSLETRALDFRHLIIFNASEGSFPGKNAGSSFIPPEVRFGFGLPTYKYRDAIWAYYFYRMISRASTVTMLYDSRTEGVATGEESRYVKQLRYLYKERCRMKEYVAVAPVSAVEMPMSIEKTEEDIERIRRMTYSASSLHHYLTCPVQFYYAHVRGLMPEREIKDNLDAGMLGTVCHSVLEKIYNRPEITQDRLRHFLTGNGKKELADLIKSEICGLLHIPEVSGQSLLDSRMAGLFVTKVLERDLALMKTTGSGTIRILGLEKKYDGIEIVPGFRFKGFIDRLDSLKEGSVRIVDYKTGGDSPAVLDPEESGKILKGIFSKNNANTFKAALQFYIYDRFVEGDPEFKGLVRENSMYAMGDIFRNAPRIYPESTELKTGIGEQLEGLFAEMTDAEKPFARRPREDEACRYCDYYMLCGRNGKQD